MNSTCRTGKLNCLSVMSTQISRLAKLIPSSTIFRFTLAESNLSSPSPLPFDYFPLMPLRKEKDSLSQETHLSFILPFSKQIPSSPRYLTPISLFPPESTHMNAFFKHLCTCCVHCAQAKMVHIHTSLSLGNLYLEQCELLLCP